MQENLRAAIRKIETAGKAFNAANEQHEEFTEAYENSAYRTIFEYILSENIHLADYDWDALAASYEDEGILEVLDPLYEIHAQVSGSSGPIDETVPLEVFALFNVLDTAFHYTGVQSPKPVLYVDMDNVIVDFPGAFPFVEPALLAQYKDDKDEIPGIFALMPPVSGAIAALEKLYRRFNLYILSTAPWQNSSAWQDKVAWVQRHLPIVGYKRLILSHHKHLCQGAYLVDDHTYNGVLRFGGEHIHFGTEKFPDWDAVLRHVLPENP